MPIVAILCNTVESTLFINVYLSLSAVSVTGKG